LEAAPIPRAIRARARLVDAQRAALKVLVVHAFDGGACRIVVRHFDETETARASAFPIRDDLGGVHRAECLEGTAKILIITAPRQIAYIDIHCYQSWY